MKNSNTHLIGGEHSRLPKLCEGQSRIWTYFGGQSISNTRPRQEELFIRLYGTSLLRSASWSGLPNGIKPIKVQRKKKESDNSDFDKRLSQLRVDHKERPAAEIPAPKAKAKTKGAALSGDPNVNQPGPQPAPQTPDTQPTLTVSKRGFKVFSIIFHTPSQSNEPGEIPWPDFLPYGDRIRALKTLRLCLAIYTYRTIGIGPLCWSRALSIVI
jgi:hypothetical protein